MKQPAVAKAQAKTIFIVDDHFLVREGLNKLISRQADMEVCGEAESAEEALALIAQRRPTLVIVDLALKGGSGLDLIKDLCFRFPDILILVLSMYPEKVAGERALRAGALGYLSKQDGPQAVIVAIRKVLDGQMFMSPALEGVLLEKIVGRREPQGHPGVAQLSDCELEAFILIAQGLNIVQIAERLGLARTTVAARCRRIREKLGAETFAKLVQQAVLWANGQSLP